MAITGLVFVAINCVKRSLLEWMAQIDAQKPHPFHAEFSLRLGDSWHSIV
jgi:hypothetical protein